MKLDYDADNVADQYKKAKMQPWRSRVEEFSLMNLIGDIQGKKVVDIACGEGYFTRKLAQAGAKEIVGFDISEQMIELAKYQEEIKPLDINYFVADARSVTSQHNFDLAVAAWLLVHAQDCTELEQMCQGLAHWLRPGGRFVTITTNPNVYFFETVPDYRQYGFEMTLADHVFEGAPIGFQLHLADSTLNVENYYLPISAYETAFHKAGFCDFKIHPLQLSPNPQGLDDHEYWADFLTHPIMILIDCIKA